MPLTFGLSAAGGHRATAGRAPLIIGLVNNMPDAALRATERQFCELLTAAAGDRDIVLRFFSMPEVPRGEIGRAHVTQHYTDIAELWKSGVSGLIVTGTEPRERDLRDEPYWPNLTRLIDWAKRNTISTVWSCLAAHAAVLHLDGVERRPFAQKLFGVFECARIADHPLVCGAPTIWRMPHSRWNDLPETALLAAGYEPLSRSPLAGIDLFVKQYRSRFVFFQGHPEYDPGALLREYRRDVGRFLAGERADYPALPQGCVDAETAAACAAFRERVLREPDSAALADFPKVATSDLPHPWQEPAQRFYTSWLAHLDAERSFRRSPLPRRERLAV